jgi:hypothetical protein
LMMDMEISTAANEISPLPPRRELLLQFYIFST